MNFLTRLNNSLSVRDRYQPLFDTATRMIHPAFYDGRQYVGDNVTLYPSDNGERYITKGYNLNDAVYSIVSKNAEKCSQIRFYHSRVKKDERKTLQEYNRLAKGTVGTREIKEMAIMRKSMIDDMAVDSDLSRLLNKPNRYQVQSEWIEQLFGFRELQGEGNLWLNRGGIEGGTPLEMYIIPRQHLNLRVDRTDPWGLIGYTFAINGSTVNWSLDDVMMWKYASYNFDPTTYEHLRGMAPLQAAMVLIQSLNEGDVRLAVSNKHGGASGMVYREDVANLPKDPKDIEPFRQKIQGTLNDSEMADKIAMFGGKWGYHNFAVSIEAQKLLEQYDYGFERLCRVFKTDFGIFQSDAKYENKRRAEKHWILSKVAPAIYQLRALLSDKLLPEFGLSPETDLIDCDVNSLPEMADDLAEQVAALKDASWLSDDEKRLATGYEAKGGIMELTQREYEENGISGNLDVEENLLSS